MGKLSSTAVKRSNDDLAKRSVNGIIMYVIGWLILSYFSSILDYQSFLVYLCGFLLVVIGSYRLFLVKYFETIYAKSERLWKGLFSLGMFASASVWSFFSALSFYHLGMSAEVIIIFLPIILFSAGGIVSLSPNKTLLISFIIILTIPQVIAFIQLATTQTYVISIMFLLFELYLLKVGLLINADYWALIISSEDNYRLYANVFEQSGEAILITDKNNEIISINSAMESDTGYSLMEIKGKNPNIFRSHYTPEETYQSMWDSIQKNDLWQGELWVQTKKEDALPKWTLISVLRDTEGKISNYIASYTDLTERKKSGQRIELLAHHDALTGLLNRMTLEQRLEQAITMAQRNRKKVAVMFIDMDRFKIINDTKGHDVGDGLLIEVANRLTKSVRKSDIVARQGGDEFVVVLTDLDDPLFSSVIATYIVHSLSQPYLIDVHSLNSSPSIGVSTYPTDGDNAMILLKNADTAMYHAKDQGRNMFKFFSEEMNTDIAEKLALENDLRAALSEEQFNLYYQPKINSLDGRIVGFEALIRWRHPEKGMMLADHFIHISEEMRLTSSLGNWVIEEAMQQSALWHSQGYSEVVIAINISLQQFLCDDFIDSVKKLIKKTAAKPNYIEFEITESIVMHDPEAIIKKLVILNAMGISLAIDDFGKGASSLAYLKRLPVQSIKIDKTFVSNLDQDEGDEKITTATISFAHILGLKVVAVGVENHRIAAEVR